VAVSRQFHERIVASCGNTTLIVVLGALEALWSTHENLWTCTLDSRYDSARRLHGIEEHVEIVEAIRSGDPNQAWQVMRDHLAHSYGLPSGVGGDQLVQAPPTPA
jgi:DNA-binding FadR family transcriptional regulator